MAPAAVRFLVGLVFVAAAAGQCRRWPEFSGVVADYRLLPGFLVPTVAYVLPIAELAVGVSLLCGLPTRVADLVAIVLLLVFALAMGVNILRGRADIDCGCFQGELRRPLVWTLVIRNVTLAALLGAATVSAIAPSGFNVEGLLVAGVLFVVLRRLDIL